MDAPVPPAWSDLVVHLRQCLTEAEGLATEAALTRPDGLPALVGFCTPDGTRTSYNRPAWSLGDAGPGWGRGDHVHPDDRDALSAALAAAAGGRAFAVEYRVPHGGGHARVLERGTPRTGADGAVAGFAAAVVHLPDPPGEVPPRPDEGRLRAAAEAGFDALFLFDAARDADGRVVDFVYVDVNRRGEELCGTPRDRLLGRRFGETPPPAGFEPLAAVFREVVETGRPREDEYQVGTPGAAAEWLRVAVVPAGGGVAVTARDVSAEHREAARREALERRAVEAQRLESLGVLAAGVAHDFNNVLAGILGNASLARRHLPDDSVLSTFLVPIERAALHAGELCRQMLAFAGKGRFTLEAIDVSAVVRDTAELLRYSAAAAAELDLRLALGLPAVTADPVQVRQALVNLVVNAAESYGPGGGPVTVSTGRQAVTEGEPSGAWRPGPPVPGEYAWLEVSDRGCGMDATTLARAFDPFFTTKFAGRGLGLSAVLGIARGHGGAVEAESAPGKGTRLRLLLPAAAAPGVAGAVPDAGVAVVADDEEPVRAVASRMLEALGFRVLAAADGREAVELVARDPSAVRLVLLDLTMPGLRGEAAAAEVRRRWPGVPVLFMSGYRDAPAGDAGEPFLAKPFRFEELARRVREAATR
jgi:signal transduction histidine kinase/CheY-like chemotaxis protein